MLASNKFYNWIREYLWQEGGREGASGSEVSGQGDESEGEGDGEDEGEERDFMITT